MTRLVAFLAIAALALLAGVALAAVPKGTYSGRTSDGGKVSLTVDKSRQLVRIVRRNLKFTCSDGDSFRSLKNTATGTVDVSSGKFDIGRRDESSAQTEADAVDWDMTGRFSARKRKVKGTYTETRRFNEEDDLDPNGSVVCRTGNLTYCAALPKKRR